MDSCPTIGEPQNEATAGMHTGVLPRYQSGTNDMAGQSRHSTRRQAASPMDVSAPVVATTSAGHDNVTLSVTSTTSVPRSEPARRPTPRSTYRTLLRRGLAPAEAANLTAYLCGIPVGAHHWELTEISRLLFLRELHVAGRFGGCDGSPDAAVR